MLFVICHLSLVIGKGFPRNKLFHLARPTINTGIFFIWKSLSQAYLCCVNYLHCRKRSV
ncbi:hypothetical protein FDUTEX481_02225 [Tolypothrix sp. PCC 7601]|nr:hypothetical protein FDUTEX481_02225 [Tolypothrix sp. PCC 7601]